MSSNPKIYLTELHYLPCIQYMTKFLLYDQVIIEAHENYQKGSYRNRCHVIGAQGIERISVPLTKGKHQQQRITDVTISYEKPWYASHWHTIKSAYGRSPYFEHYSDDLKEILYSKHDHLFDLNSAILNWLVKAIGLNPTQPTTEYVKIPLDSVDHRNLIHPKKEYADVNFVSKPYFQVFDDRHPFAPNLSAIDVLFAKGPETKGYLRDCQRMSC